MMIAYKIVNRKKIACRASTFANGNRPTVIFIIRRDVLLNDDEGLEEEDLPCGIGLVI